MGKGINKAITEKPISPSNRMGPKVLFISSEVSPFAKVGGLADVVGSLPKALCDIGCDVRVIIPFYHKVKQKYLEKARLLRWTMIKLGWRTQYSGLYTMEYEGILYYFIDNEYFFGHEKIYVEYSLDIERFCFFQRAVLEAIGEPMGFEPDILHCNDWQSGMIPCLLKAHYQSQGYHQKMKTVFTIHNLKYQGIHGREMIQDLMDMPPSYMTEEGAVLRGDANFMKAGIVYSDAVTTVSETYAKEILTQEYGEGLEGVLWKYSFKISGIENGINAREYDPAYDPAIPVNFDKNSVSLNKPLCKAALQKELHLAQNPDIPLCAMVTRLVDQKGLDLLLLAQEDLLEIPIQIAVLGTGDPYYENVLADISSRKPDWFSANITFDNSLAHRIYAACDLFLMPSLFEPCGISQLISMQYGTIPVVRETGGLKDTVIPYNEISGEGTGFSFANVSSGEFSHTVRTACRIYHTDKDGWKRLVRRAMERDSSWTSSAVRYVGLYQEMRKV